MSSGARIITVFGGTGFIGRRLVLRLAEAGHAVRIACRNAEQARPGIANVVPVVADVTDERTIGPAVESADTVINLARNQVVGKHQTHGAVHHQGAAAVARAAAAAGVRRLLVASTMGADAQAPAQYARAKAAGEAAVLAAFPGAVIVRPNIVFGENDNFFGKFAQMARGLPALPLFGKDVYRFSHEGGKIRFLPYGSGGQLFQPVYVGDVVEAFVRLADQPPHAGGIYELNGPRQLSMRDVLTLVNRFTGMDRPLLPLPLWAAHVLAALVSFLPTPPLTADQARLLAADLVAGELPGLAELGIDPTPCEPILAAWLGTRSGSTAPA